MKINSPNTKPQLSETIVNFAPQEKEIIEVLCVLTGMYISLILIL